MQPAEEQEHRAGLTHCSCHQRSHLFPRKPSGTWLGMSHQPFPLPYPACLLSLAESFPVLPTPQGYSHSPPGTSGHPENWCVEKS